MQVNKSTFKDAQCLDGVGSKSMDDYFIKPQVYM